MMSNRSAEASIKGYNYQFLHTIKDILENESDTYENIVEGIEDLDIDNGNEKKLIQYKYHEEKSYNNSRVAKPIGLMFNHFLRPTTKAISYKLYIYLIDDTLNDITDEILLEILKLKSATDYIDETCRRFVTNKVLVSKFNNIFTCKLTQKYDDLQNDIISSFESIVSLSNEDAKIIYFANAIKIINDLAIQSSEANRKITKRALLSELSTYKDILYSSHILREKGFLN